MKSQLSTSTSGSLLPGIETIADCDPLIPAKLLGKEFEAFVDDRGKQLRAAGIASIGRYGTTAVHMMNQQTRRLELTAIPSKPDFEGVNHQGRQFIFDCKVCSQSKFDLQPYRSSTKGSKAKQLRFMLERAEFGVPCFFLIHWNRRELVTKTDVQQTWAVYVRANDPYWTAVENGEISSMTRGDCETLGRRVRWFIPPRCRNVVPDLADAVPMLRGGI